MDHVLYEADCEVWRHPKGPAAVVSVAGPIDSGEEQRFREADRIAATWSREVTRTWSGPAKAEESQDVLALYLRAETGTESAAVGFVVAQPSPELIEALLAPAEGGITVLRAYSTRSRMKTEMVQVAANPTLVASGSTAAFYQGHFRLEDGTLDPFKN